MPTLKLNLPAELAHKLFSFGDHLRHKDRFSLPKREERIVQKITSFYLQNAIVELRSNSIFYRARIHAPDQTEKFKAKAMGAPPPLLATPGRINPDGISYLYAAAAIKTAIAEVRPWMGANISVGTFKTKRQLRAVNLSDQSDSIPDGDSKAQFESWAGNWLVARMVVQRFFSAPTHTSDRFAYLPSQFLAERF